MSGLSPFGGADDEQTAENIKRCDLRLPSDAFGNISEEGHDFIKKLLVKAKASRMNVYEALEHPWLADLESGSTLQIPSSKYEGIRNKIKQRYMEWPDPRPAIGITSNFSSLRKLRPKEYGIYSSYFDRRDANPRFVIRPRNLNVQEGQNAFFNCIILAVSPPVVTWTFQGAEIRQSTKHMKRYNRYSYALEVNLNHLIVMRVKMTIFFKFGINNRKLKLGFELKYKSLF